MTIETAKFWLEQIWQYGWPTCALLGIVALFVWAVRAVWTEMVPLITALFQAIIDTFKRTMQFIDAVEDKTKKQGQAIGDVAITSEAGHQETHQRLGEVEHTLGEHGRQLSEIHGVIVKPQPPGAGK